VALDEFNPYASPKADVAPAVDAADGDMERAERIRRENLGRETNVKAIGSLYLIGAIFQGLGLLIQVLQLAGTMPTNRAGAPLALQVFNLAFGIALLGLNVGIAIGLRTLQTWARWTAVVLNSLGLTVILLAGAGIALAGQFVIAAFVVVLAGGITGAILYVLASPRSSIVFTPAYQAIIAMTPRIRYRTSRLALIGLMVFIAVVVIAVAVALRGTR
jgi:hypothetical protein